MLKQVILVVLTGVLGIALPAAGASLQAPPTTAAPTTVQLVEYYHSGLDHYFVTAIASEIAALDTGATGGWARTGYEMTVHAGNSTVGGNSPVCRFYGLPGAGLNSHFYSGSADECAAVAKRFARSWQLESMNVFQVVMPDSSGACPPNTVPIYRLYNNRSDTNHRYTDKLAVRQAMVSQGYISEGWGSSGVAFCGAAPASGAGTPPPNSTPPNPTPPNPTPPTPAPQQPSNPTAAIVVTAISSDTFDFSSTASASAGATIVSYAWDFGDGKRDTGATVSHRYTASGTFPVVLTVKDSNQKSATVTKSVLATVSPPPAPPPPPPAPPPPPPPPVPPPPTTGTVYYTQVGPAQTSFKYASRALAVHWQKEGGDWRDANGVLNGPTATSSIVPSSDGMQSMDISRIDGDVLLQGAAYVDSVRIDGTPVTAFWTSPSSLRSVLLPSSGTRQPVFIKNPMRGRTLTFTARFAAGKTLRVDAVAAPEIPNYLPYAGPSNVPDVWEFEMISEQQVYDFVGRWRYAGHPSWKPREPKSIHDPQFGVDSYGIHYLRFAGITTTERLIAWYPGFDPREEAYCRYLLWIEDDVADGMTEVGMKLPGLFAGYPLGPTERVSWRMWHGRVDPANRGIYRYTDYRYDAARPRNEYPDTPETGAHLIANRWNVIEQRAKLNTPGMSDGVLEIWLNGHLVMRDTAKVWRRNASTKWDSVHVNVFHGGQDLFPSQKIHYRIAKIAVSSRYIGVPKELMNAR